MALQRLGTGLAVFGFGAVVLSACGTLLSIDPDPPLTATEAGSSDEASSTDGGSAVDGEATDAGDGGRLLDGAVPVTCATALTSCQSLPCCGDAGVCRAGSLLCAACLPLGEACVAQGDCCGSNVDCMFPPVQLPPPTKLCCLKAGEVPPLGNASLCCSGMSFGAGMCQ